MYKFHQQHLILAKMILFNIFLLFLQQNDIFSLYLHMKSSIYFGHFVDASVLFAE